MFDCNLVVFLLTAVSHLIVTNNSINALIYVLKMFNSFLEFSEGKGFIRLIFLLQVMDHLAESISKFVDEEKLQGKRLPLGMKCKM